MVRELDRERQTTQFPETAPAANPVFFRTYSRRTEKGRETWEEVCDRTVQGLTKLGQLTTAEAALIHRMQRQLKTLSSGRWLWVGGSEWIEQPQNFSGAYNCSSTNISDWRAFGLLMDLAMMGCGTGAVLEPKYINQLPPIRNRLNVSIQDKIGFTPADLRREETEVKIEENQVTIYVGDSRQGWVKSYQTLLELSTDEQFSGEVQVSIDLSDVRAAGEPLKGFGGVANPVKLAELYDRCASILNKALGRQLNSVECCLLIDEAAVTIVAGNIRRCIAYGTRVSAISGIKPIQDIQVGELVLTSSGEYRPVVNKFVQGVQNVVEIRTPATSIRCTANHRVAVYDSLSSYTWKYAGELQKGDRLISVPHNKGADCANTDYAWLLGFYIGDGNTDLESSKRRKGGGGTVTFAFYKARLEGKLGEKCLHILQRLGYTPSVSYKDNTGYIRVYRKDLAVELSQYKQPWGVPVIPEIIWKGTPEIRAAFLAGLSDADGTPSRNVLTNSNKLEFLREVQKLALSLGIATTLHERKPKTLKGIEKVYEGCHWIQIRGLQSQAVTVSLINQFAVRDGFTLKLGKKNGLDLPYHFVQELVTTGWQPTTVRTATAIIADPKIKYRQFRDANFDTLLAEDLVNPHWLPMEVQFVAPAGEAETFDIEVEGDHEFIADGLLVHNSAGMRQFNSEDELGANAKNNLWQQDENGNWRIDPERDSLRMANHSRVFHHKPTLEESIEAVRKQYYSGEGAIQWAGEAIARSNSDLLTSSELKADFIKAYAIRKGQQWLQEHFPQITVNELDHRLARYGLNPCHSGDTLVSTDQGLVPIKDLVGKHFQTLVDLRSVGLDGLKLTDAIAFSTGVQTTYIVTVGNGMQMRCTADHQHFTNQGWVATKDLNSSHAIYIQKGQGNFGKGTITVEQAQMLGWLYGDGSIYQGFRGLDAVFYINKQEYTTVFPVLAEAVQSLTGYNHKPSFVKGVYTFHSGSPLISSFFQDLGIQSKDCLPDTFLSQSKEVIIGFLQGLFCADGCVSVKARHIELRNRSKELLRQVQLLILNLGIKSSLKLKQKPGGKGVPYTLKNGTDKVSQNRGSWRLIVYSGDGARNFWELIGFPLVPEKQQRLEQLATKKQTRNYSEAVVNQWYTSKVQSVEEFGEEAVYDLHVPLTHSFIANGCVTHNCGEILGSNFHCVSGDTLLITRDGIHKIKDVVSSEVEIWNGQNWSKVTPFNTGSDRKLYRVQFSDGSYLDATEYHRFFVKDRFGKVYKEVQTKDLMDTSRYAIHTEPFTIQYQDGLSIDPGYAYTLGVAVGDGTTDQKDNAKVRLYGKKAALSVSGNKSPERNYDYSPAFTDVTELGFSGLFLKALKTNPEALNVIASWNRQAILHFIAGLADTDGSNTSSNGIGIYISDYQRAYRVQLLLTKCGIRSSLNLLAHQGSITNYGIGSQDLYYLQITECEEIPCQRLDVSKGTDAKYKGKWQVVKSVEELPGLHNTYCFNESEYNKGVFGNTLTGNCNLSEIHLNQIDPKNYKEQEEAFTAGALSVATLLNHKFGEPRYQYSRELDPIVGVSFTGLFDFFVNAFGVDWLRWWTEGRPETPQGLEFKRQEEEYLNRWRETVHGVVWDYCDRHNLKRPNRCTTVQPSGTKSLLTGASPGWHPPKAQRFIRRITFRKNDPVALACIDYGYNVIPSQSDKDENGNLLNDPFDPRCSEWLVEIPVSVDWADLPGADEIEIGKFSALAQTDFYMQVQKFYVRHNTSATIELRENEVEALGTRIYEAIRDDEGYISAALLARFDSLQNFPRLPFEPIAKQEYDRLLKEVEIRRTTDDFLAALMRYDSGYLTEAGPAGCDSDKCMMPEQKPGS